MIENGSRADGIFGVVSVLAAVAEQKRQLQHARFRLTDVLSKAAPVKAYIDAQPPGYGSW